MFTPLAMSHVTLYLLREEAPAAALILARLGVFAPEQDVVPAEALPEQPGTRFNALYVSATRRLDKILAYTRLRPAAPGDGQDTAVVTAETLSRVDDQLGDIWREFSRHEEEERSLLDEQRQVAQLRQALMEYEALDVDLGLLQGGLQFLDVHVGTVAGADVLRLREALSLLGYSLSVFKETDGTAHTVVAGLAGSGGGLDRVLKTAAFRPVTLPREFQDRPSRLREQLQSRWRKVEEALRTHERTVEDARNKNRDAILAAAGTLARAALYHRLTDGLHARGGLARVGGWVPQDRVDALRRALAQLLGGRVTMTVRTPEEAERLVVPSAFRHPRWLRPFAALVRGYGIPRYGEVDPTWLFAVTFVAMFGMMFGDVGQGAVIAAAGLLLPRKWRGYTPFAVAAGLSSVAFGFCYGSVFGAELIRPLWLSPMTDPLYMLRVALYWGIGFILLAGIITVRNRLAEGRYAEALLDANGGMGMLLYIGLLYGGNQLVRHGAMNAFGVAAVVLPLALILWRIWRINRTGTGERILIVMVEGFETVMRYIANTLSFLRVAAFSLNHVALSVAIYMMAGMMDTAGHWGTVVAGNVFMLVLEGGIVAIQVLRLEYYEGFSRFFSGDGRAFSPLTLSASVDR
jgi:V/A-type H+-transporting ATPase subunit I